MSFLYTRTIIQWRFFTHVFKSVFIVVSSAYARHTEKTEACTCSCPPLEKPGCVDTACDPSCAGEVFCNTAFLYNNTSAKLWRGAWKSSCLDHKKGKRRTDRRHRFMLQSIFKHLLETCNLLLCSVLYSNDLELQISDQPCKAGNLRWFYNTQWHKASQNCKLILSFPSSINWIYQHVIKCATKIANLKVLKGPQAECLRIIALYEALSVKYWFLKFVAQLCED